MNNNGSAPIQPIPISKLTGHEGARPPAALVRSISEQGFLAEFPIIVMPQADDSFRILDGRRRTAAAEKARLDTVLAVETHADAALTILAHATRSENPVAELKAYQELVRAGMGEKEIARAGYATLQRVRKVGKLNNLIPELAERVELGEIAPGVAFQIASLAPEVQAELAKEERLNGPLVKEYRSAQRKDAMQGTPDWAEIFEATPLATIEELLEVLSSRTLEAILADLPNTEKFVVWRGKIRQRVSMSSTVALPLEIKLEVS